MRRASTTTRVADADSQAELIELARHTTAAQLERMVRAARRCTAAEADEARRESFVRWYWEDDDGCLRIEAKLPPEFVTHAVVPEDPLELPPEEIEANRDRWVKEWTRIVLR